MKGEQMSEKREQIIERFMRDTEHKAISLYNHGVKEGSAIASEDAYEQGRADAWELIKRLLDMGIKDFSETFDGADCLEDIRYMDIDDIAERMKEYEDSCREDIEAGDEVIDPNGLVAIVTNTDTHYHLLYKGNGKTWKAPKSTKLKKTGHKYQAMEFLPF